MKHLFDWGVVFQVGDGAHCRFWEDCWAKRAPLKILYADLYKLTRDPSCFVSECREGDSWYVDFKRSLTSQEYDSWLGLLEDIKDVTLTDNKTDSVHWELDKSRKFSTKSLYRFITDRGTISRVAQLVWKSKIPLKIKIFLWQLFNNKLQTAQNLAKKGWKGDVKCCLCGVTESVDHIFFHCPMAIFVWSFIKHTFGLGGFPKDLNDFCQSWLRGGVSLPNKLIMFLFAGISWALWNSRNKLAISKVAPKASSDVIFNAISYMQKWSVGLKEQDREHFERLKGTTMEGLRNFKPSDVVLSYVGEI